MRSAIISAAVAISALAMAGCAKEQATCSGKDGIDVVRSIIQEAAEKSLAEEKRDDGSAVFNAASARATFSKMTITIENIRTSKEDPDSTKVFCEGSIKIVVPPDVLQSAEEGRKLANFGTVSALASTTSMEQSANAFSKSVEYSVQPTDDGEKVYAELDPHAVAQFMSDLVGSSLLKPMLEAKKIEEAKAAEAGRQAAEAQRLENEQQQEQLRTEQNAANLSVAQEQNTLANQAINELWKNISEEERDFLLGSQRAWIKKKDVDCKIEAAGRSTDPTEIETLRLNCDTTATRARIAEIQRSL